MLLSKLNLTFQWGCGNYSGYGDGGAYDGDGIGDNQPEYLSPEFHPNPALDSFGAPTLSAGMARTAYHTYAAVGPRAQGLVQTFE
mmetsp:Transcript_20194/g.31571  ORF Transcript_20194/g.31571 Transcript_20194/m.31571 type:complete len:85 (-) Transcript_20194:329-583(-)